MTWQTKRLEDVADFCLGKMLDQNKNRGDFLPYLANINVRWGEFDFNDLREMRFEQHELDRFGLRYGDIVMCEGGEPGRCSIWRDQRPGMMIQKAIHRIRPHACLLPDFLFYLFLHKGRSGQFAPLFTGATIKHLPREKLALVEVEIPPHSTQKRIVDLLKAYDDLIENNRRRIQLLEQTARLLYKEWFVHLRFPGHEHVKITNGVPEGWEQTGLEAACIPQNGIQTGPFGSQLHQHDYVDVGYPVVMPKDIDATSRVSTKSIARVPDEIRRRLSRHVLQAGDIVLARRGDIGRKALVTERESGWMCGTGCMRLRPNSSVALPRYLFHTLGRADVMGLIAGRAQGAIMPNLNLAILADVPLVLAPRHLQLMFDDIASRFERLSEVLHQKNEQLTKARDLLLPRLMNGEIPV
jgi:type I restriction enzyme S subunit